jgi:hypothetical protein
MDKEVVLDNENITVWYYPQKKIIHHEFHKFTQGRTFQEALSKGAATLEKNKAKKWLSDDRKNSVLTLDDTKWTASFWRPRVIKAGWKYWAIVLPEKAVGQMVMQRIIKEYADTGVTVKIFSDSVKAMTWLEAQQ